MDESWSNILEDTATSTSNNRLSRQGNVQEGQGAGTEMERNENSNRSSTGGEPR